MTFFLFLVGAFGLAALLALIGYCWLCWELLQQNGRMLLRLEELEKRFDEFEFGGEDGSVESASAMEASIGDNGDARANRFGERSLARSKIKRDGLKAGTPAPSFRLPRLDGHGELSLEDFRGHRVLLVFSSPHCGPCNALAPELEKLYRSQNGGLGSGFGNARTVGEGGTPLTPALSPSDGERVADRPGEGKPRGISVVMISKGEPKENRAKVKEHRLTFPIVLQQQWEISRLYAIFATPVAYLVDADGVLLKDVAVGLEPIVELMSSLLEPALTT